MKKHVLLFALNFVLVKFSSAQVICVQCYNQNDSIGVNVGSHNLIVNGGFENTTCATNCSGVYCPNSTTHNCDISNWSCTGGGSLTYGCVYDSANYFVVQGSRSVYFGSSYANPCSGTSASTFPNNDTLCLQYSGCTISGIPSGYPLSGTNYGGVDGLSLSQTIHGLTAGKNYALEFWAGGEYEGWFFKNGMFAVDVGFGNIFLNCKITHQLPDVGTRYIIQFAPTADSATIKFTNWGHICGTCTELVLDDVRLYDPAYLPGTVPTCFVGENDLNKGNVGVYPNPAYEVLNVKTSSNLPSKITIYDLASRKLLQQCFTTSVSLNTESLSKGIYFYEVLNGEELFKGKIIKE